jgi:tetratricopeptide (TPR) repeat protein
MADNKNPSKTVPSQPIPQPLEEKVAFFDHQSGAFFRKLDWGAFWTTFLITLGVYCYTLAPTVTLEDSGELAVGSDYLGVPHPPGYPSWTLITWFFQWIFGWVRYYGHPNPAWGVGLASAVFGALACGILALLVSRSGTDMLRSLKKTTDVIGFSTESLLCWVGGVSGGLLLAFSPVLWSQSVIVEVYALNAFFQMLILLLTYMWMCRPKEDKLLYITAFAFGFGITNHQTLLFVGPALVAAIWFRDRALFRDCMAALFLCAAAYLFWTASTMTGNLPPEALREKNTTTTLALLFLLAPVGLFLIERKLMTEWKRVLLIGGLCILGLGFNAFMPISSDQNPPINWGYPRTPEGFKHAITRGQYEKITVSDIFTAKFLAQLGAYFGDLKQQFTLPIAILGLAPFFFIGKIDRRGRTWLITSLVAFVSLSIVLIMFQNPDLDIQTLFIGRVQFIQSHAVYAIWLGYGVLFALTYLETLLGGRGIVKPIGLVAVVALPLTLLYQNAFDKEQIKIVGGAEQNQHEFGWQFGNWELQGVDGIRSDLSYKKAPSEFDAIWKEFPTPKYPLPMETNAIFFGGTDPGRFVPTYMIYCAKVRPDVYLITQNALADNTYMSVMRDLYGDTIWIPSQQDSNYAFQKYVEDVQAGRIPAGADVQFENGRVSVQGVQGVMMINGILCRMIFEANKQKHAFYVEESYVIPWMYPYLTPNGLIMKLNSETQPSLSPEMVKNDRDFWDWYSKRLLGNPKFLRDVVARKTFSKLRGAIAGIYAFRRMYPEAEYAFQQAIDLYPLSPEANFRLADVFMQQRRFSDAGKLIEKFLYEDPGNSKVRDFLNQIRETEKADSRRVQLEAQFNQGQGELNTAMELADLYRKLNMEGQFQGLTMNILNDTNIPANAYLAVAKMYADSKRMDLLAVALEKYLAREPANPKVWIDLAAIQAAMQKPNECIQSVRRAIELGGEPVRDIIRKDQRFNPVRETPEFKSLVPQIQQQGLPMNLPNLPMM